MPTATGHPHKALPEEGQSLLDALCGKARLTLLSLTGDVSLENMCLPEADCSWRAVADEQKLIHH